MTIEAKLEELIGIAAKIHESLERKHASAPTQAVARPRRAQSETEVERPKPANANQAEKDLTAADTKTEIPYEALTAVALQIPKKHGRETLLATVKHLGVDNLQKLDKNQYPLALSVLKGVLEKGPGVLPENGGGDTA